MAAYTAPLPDPGSPGTEASDAVKPSSMAPDRMAFAFDLFMLYILLQTPYILWSILSYSNMTFEALHEQFMGKLFQVSRVRLTDTEAFIIGKRRKSLF
ncbi:hypothetical protein J15TS10_30180 [Paenibacillus woosongensis]|uniref:Uncharacterized protein n=1 Tax=Paenibacillus woosongensis TaxID=307580 RepID=A0ABQ4MTE4_9BACL|nr:hypothetical protein J15TS10_30180 [Paenibacillus woosongensis]